MQELFDICVAFMYWLAHTFNSTYVIVNVWLFVIIMPLIIVWLFILYRHYKIKYKILKAVIK